MASVRQPGRPSGCPGADRVTSNFEVLAQEAWARKGKLLSARADRWVVQIDTLVAKVYLRRGLLDLWADRGQRAAKRAQIAQKRGLPVPAFRGLVRLPQATVAFFDFVDASTFEAAWSRSDRRRLIQTLADLVKQLHQARIYPGDFHRGNILVGEQLWLLDPDQLRPVWWLSRRRQVRSLERLFRDFVGVPKIELMRFLLRYSKSGQEARTLWRAIAARTEKKRAQYQLPGPQQPVDQ